MAGTPSTDSRIRYPEDIKALAPPILRHRVLPNYYAESDGVTVDDILNSMLNDLAAPAAAA